MAMMNGALKCLFVTELGRFSLETWACSRSLKAVLSCFLLSNAEVELFSSCRNEVHSQTDFFNKIGPQLTLVPSYCFLQTALFAAPHISTPPTTRSTASYHFSKLVCANSPIHPD